MPRTEITKQARTRAGLTPTTVAVDATAAPNGMKFLWTPTAEVIVKNGDSGAHTMTVQSGVVTSDALAITGKTVAVPVTSTNLPTVGGPYDASYRQADGYVYLNFDAATSMTVAVLD